jgi:hypothetical protein
MEIKKKGDKKTLTASLTSYGSDQTTPLSQNIKFLHQ